MNQRIREKHTRPSMRALNSSQCVSTFFQTEKVRYVVFKTEASFHCANTLNFEQRTCKVFEVALGMGITSLCLNLILVYCTSSLCWWVLKWGRRKSIYNFAVSSGSPPSPTPLTLNLCLFCGYATRQKLHVHHMFHTCDFFVFLVFKAVVLNLEFETHPRVAPCIWRVRRRWLTGNMKNGFLHKFRLFFRLLSALWFYIRSALIIQIIYFSKNINDRVHLWIQSIFIKYQR